MLAFVDEMEFERLGVFCLSAEEASGSWISRNQIPEEIKEERRDAIMELQQEICL